MLTITFDCYSKLFESEHYWKSDSYILGMWNLEVVNLSFIYILLTLVSFNILKY